MWSLTWHLLGAAGATVRLFFKRQRCLALKNIGNHYGNRTETNVIYLHVSQEKILQRLLGNVCCSGMVATPHNAVQALKLFGTESPQRPCPLPLLCQVAESMHIDEWLLLGFAAETPLIFHIKTLVQVLQTGPLFLKVLHYAMEGVVVVVIKPCEEHQVEHRLLPVEPKTKLARKPY